MTNIGVGSNIHFIVDLMAVELSQSSLWMRSLDSSHIVHVSEKQIVDSMGHIQGGDLSLHLQPCIDILIGMTTYMEIPWDFLDCEISLEPASSVILEGFLCQLILFLRTGLSQQFKIIPVVDLISIAIETIFFDRSYIGTMRKHGILNVQRDHLTWEAMHNDIKMNP